MTEEYYKKKINRRDILLKQCIKEIKYLRQELDKYKKVALTDSLTKLNNRRALENISNYDSLILGDIDHFKYINDMYGHTTGDLVLIDISSILKDFVRDSDLVCRWGGEEFVILLKNCSEMDAYNKSIQLKNEISKLSKKYGFKITMSFGVTTIKNNTLKTAIEHADEAMYESKEKGRNTVTIYKLAK